MRYQLLGRSGLRVSEVCLGTMTFGEDWGWGASREESGKIFSRFVEAGGNFIDTACNYTDGTSEKFVGELVGGDRDRFVVATKYTLSWDKRHLNAGGNHRRNMQRSVEESLKRLQTDYIDLFWLHVWDQTTRVDEIMRGLDDLVRSGKVQYVGISDSPAWVVSRANTMADLRGWSPFVALQLPYNLTRRDAERELLPMARALDLAVTTWGLLAGGVLTGKYNRGTTEATRQNKEDIAERNLGIAGTVLGVADASGYTPTQIAVAWVRRQQALAQIIPILGVRTLTQLDDNLKALDVKLDDAMWQKLDEASAIELGFPSEFIAVPYVQELIHGEQVGLLDSHRESV